MTQSGAAALSHRPAYTPRIILRFVAELRLPYTGSAEAEHAARYHSEWEELLSAFPGVRLRPFFERFEPEMLQSLERRAKAAGLSPGLHSHFAILVPELSHAVEIAKKVAGWSHVEFAYLEGGPIPPPLNPSNNPM